MNQVFLGDCLAVLKTLPDESVDCIVTDPPYGLGTREPTLEEILAYLQGSILDTGGDFMGHAWSIPPVAVWRECLRVLKPGGHLLSFAGTRTLHLIGMGIQVAGFQSRDTVATQFGTTVLQWLYGQGFPKSLNIAKALARVGASPEVVERWKGWGTALKPAWEPVLVFRKPLESTTVMGQVMLSGTGAFNLDALRIRTQDNLNGGAYSSSGGRQDLPGADRSAAAAGMLAAGKTAGVAFQQPMGRWPANVLLVHSSGCKVVGSKRVAAPVINRFVDGMKPFGDGAGHAYETIKTGDADGMEEIPVYECSEGCPVRLLDQQSGTLAAGASPPKKGLGSAVVYGEANRSGVAQDRVQLDAGGASRFFGQLEPDAPFFYTGKVSKAERNKGLVSRFFREGMVVLNSDLDENDAEALTMRWPDNLPSPFAIGPDGGPLHIAKDSIPPDLLAFFEDVAKEGNPHPTMKPLALMKWLVQLVVPKGSVVLDPYCGSGTTCVAALESDCKYIGIERDPVFHEVAVRRIAGLQAGLETSAGERRAAEGYDLMIELAQKE